MRGLRFVVLICSLLFPLSLTAAGEVLRGGAAAVELHATDDMIIGGSIFPGHVRGQEGKLRACALVLEGPPNGTRIAIVALDVLMMSRTYLDPAVREASERTGIPFENILVNCTHTHHAPSTCRVHAYEEVKPFCQQVQKAIVKAIVQATAELDKNGPVTIAFGLGKEERVGRNSRLLLSDGTIYWIGPRRDAVRPTGPVDPDVPVLVLRRRDGSLVATLFGHSVHTIGTLKGAVRSPGFYGLAAQELEAKHGGVWIFLEGASGSTHRLDVSAAAAKQMVEKAVLEAFQNARPISNPVLAAIKRPFVVRVRHFDEEKEEHAVTSYCRKRVGGERAERIAAVFRRMRQELRPLQGQERTTWLQTVAVGDVAFVGVPAEFFTVLGVQIKKRSPFQHTVIAELANDWIGYVPDREAYELGGYQVWTGLHSWVARGTGEAIVDECVKMLHDLKQKQRLNKQR